MVDTVYVKSIQERRSRTPGYRPGAAGAAPLLEGEPFTNLADGKSLIGDGSGGGIETDIRPMAQQLASGPLADALANRQPLSSTLTALAVLNTTAFGRGLLEQVDASSARQAVGIREITETVTVTALNTLAPLANTPNGVRLAVYVYGLLNGSVSLSPAFSISGKQITWLATKAAGGFDLEPGDPVQVRYTY